MSKKYEISDAISFELFTKNADLMRRGTITCGGRPLFSMAIGLRAFENLKEGRSLSIRQMTALAQYDGIRRVINGEIAKSFELRSNVNDKINKTVEITCEVPEVKLEPLESILKRYPHTSFMSYTRLCEKYEEPGFGIIKDSSRRGFTLLYFESKTKIKLLHEEFLPTTKPFAYLNAVVGHIDVVRAVNSNKKDWCFIYV